jgi:hypothetical protein
MAAFDQFTAEPMQLLVRHRLELGKRQAKNMKRRGYFRRRKHMFFPRLGINECNTKLALFFGQAIHNKLIKF